MRNDQVAIAIPTRPTTAAGSSSTSEEQNKALVLRLYSEAFNQDKTDLVRELVGADFVQHDKSVPGGADGQVKLFQDLKASWDPRYYQHNPATRT